MLSKYFSPDFLFTSPVELHRADKAFMLIAAVAAAAAIVLSVLRSRKRTVPHTYVLLGKWSSLAWTIGIFGILWSGLRYEAIQMLSAHVVIMALYLIGLIWAVFILIYQCGAYQQQRKEFDQKRLREKYM